MTLVLTHISIYSYVCAQYVVVCRCSTTKYPHMVERKQYKSFEQLSMRRYVFMREEIFNGLRICASSATYSFLQSVLLSLIREFIILDHYVLAAPRLAEVCECP